MYIYRVLYNPRDGGPTRVQDYYLYDADTVRALFAEEHPFAEIISMRQMEIDRRGMELSRWVDEESAWD